MTIAEALDELKRKRAAIAEAIGESLDTVGESVVRQVKGIWPVDTGKSKRGWYFTRGKITARAATLRIRNDVPYTGHVHDRKADKMVPDLLRQSEPIFHRILIDRLNSV